MTVVFAIVLPVFGLMLAGYGFVRAKLLDDAGVRGLSAFVFYAAIPALLFRSLAVGAGSGGAGIGIVYTYFGGCFAVFGLAMLVGRLCFGNRLEEQAMTGMNATFSNSVQLGIPIVFAAFGAAGEAAVLLIIAFHSVTLLTLATALVELGLGRGKGPRHAILSVLRALVTNPVIVAIAAGALWSRSGLPLPAAVEAFLHLLAGAGAPCALFALGASLAGLRIAGDLAESITVVAFKLFVLPGVIWLLGRFVFSLPPVELGVAVVVAAIPTGANAFILAQRYNIYVQRSASIIVITTVLAFVTLSAVLAAMTPVP